MSKLIKITWVDSHSPSQYPWVNRDQIDHGLLKIKSVGWVIYEDNHTITIAGQLDSVNSDEGQVANVISIPKCSILKRKSL